MNTVGNGSNGYPINQKQEQAIREYLQESIVPLIEQVLVKKLGQAMSYAAKELVNPKREWIGLTDEEIATISVECATVSPSDIYFARAIEAAHGIKEKNT
jgi:hypothetical protein